MSAIDHAVMKTTHLRTKCALALAVAGMLAIGPALAKKPSWAGDGKGDRGERSERRDHFEDRHRVIVRDYYSEQHSKGRCPPGLAKKHNGCMPPGQARKWNIGEPLPRDVVYYTVPQPLVVQFGQPPSGYRYVRVASDILLMAIGTGMIVDAIRDLGRT
jgi:Ni/Co efflux regulator RcnB